MTDIALLKTELQGLKVEDNPAIVKQKSRDFFWYSPVLKRQLDHVTADLVVSPKDEAEVIRVLEACYRLGVPVTPRGSGTGNYGQAMPLAGGVVLSLAEMNKVKSIARGRVTAEAGTVLADIDRADAARSRRSASSPRPTTPPPSAASSPAARAAAARSAGAGSATSATCSASASSPWRRSRACSS